MSQPNQWTAGFRTYRDNYPTGYKHCSDCKHWRPVFDFGVRQWADEPVCTVPRTLTSVCLCCSARRRRRPGGQPRQWYQHGRADTERYREHRRIRNRTTARERRQDPEKRRRELEYQRIWVNAKTGRVSQSIPPRTAEPVDPKGFLQWLDARAGAVTLTDGEVHLIRAYRRGGRAELAVIDRIMTRAGDYDQVAVIYPLEEPQGLTVAA